MCPAALPIAGADRSREAVLCRIDSTDRGQRDAHAGPVALVRAIDSPVSFHGYCHGDLTGAERQADDLGQEATPVQRGAALSSRAGVRLCYRDCPSWRAERDNRNARRLAELPGRDGPHGAT